MFCLIFTENDLDDDDDENTCECPCQCNLDQDLCPTSKLVKQVSHPVCPPEVQLDVTPPSREVLMTSLPLPPCFERDCGRRTSKESCFGVIGCSWCEREATTNGGTLVEVDFLIYNAHFLLLRLRFTLSNRIYRRFLCRFRLV